MKLNKVKIEKQRAVLAKHIKDRRISFGISQTELASASSVSIATIKRMENNKSYPGLKELLSVCFILKLEISATIIDIVE